MKMTSTRQVTANKTTKMEFINNGNDIKRTTKFSPPIHSLCWIVEIIRAGEVIRKYECSTIEEAQRCK